MINISRSKDNQVMKFSRLIEYNMRNIFLVKLYTKCGGEVIPRTFSEKWKLSISLDHKSKVLYSLFLSYAKLRGLSKNMKLSSTPIAFISYKAFLQNKKRSGTSLPASFSIWFVKKNLSIVIFYYLTKFHCLVVFTSWDIGQYVQCNCFLIRLWRHKFWN